MKPPCLRERVMVMELLFLLAFAVAVIILGGVGAMFWNAWRLAQATDRHRSS